MGTDPSRVTRAVRSRLRIDPALRWLTLSLALLLSVGAGCEESTPPAEEPPTSPETREEPPPPPAPAPARVEDDLRRFGELRARVIGDEGNVQGAPVVVLLHGYGAAGDDLVPLARQLDAPEGTRFVLPEAPIDIGGSGRAWWRLDVERLRHAEARDLSGEVPEGMPRARRQVLQLLAAVQQELGVEPAHIVVAGFSQGAMLALDAALHLDEPLAGVVAMSGTLVSEEEWRPRMEARAPMPVLLSHGRQDPLLPFRMAERLRETARDAGLSVTWVPFDGGHGIPPEVVEAFEAFVREKAPAG